MRRLILGGVLLAVAGLAMGGTAQAERCSPDGKICLLTEATPEQPYQPPQAIQVAVDSAATEVAVSPFVGSLAQVITSGPPGGMSVWQAELAPLEFDGTISLDVRARIGTGADTKYLTATFSDLPVLATALIGESRVRRTGRRYVGTFNYSARRPLAIEQQLWLTTHTPYTSQVMTEVTETHVGAGTATMRVDAATVREFCRTNLRCYLTLVSTVSIGGEPFGQEQLAGGPIKTARPRCVRRVERLLERSRRLRGRNPRESQRRWRQARRLHRRCYDWSVQPEEPSVGAHPPEGRPPLLEPRPEQERTEAGGRLMLRGVVVP